jgi:hypothetical protein
VGGNGKEKGYIGCGGGGQVNATYAWTRAACVELFAGTGTL